MRTCERSDICTERKRAHPLLGCARFLYVGISLGMPRYSAISCFLVRFGRATRLSTCAAKRS